jgi:hypothetical protein
MTSSPTYGRPCPHSDLSQSTLGGVYGRLYELLFYIVLTVGALSLFLIQSREIISRHDCLNLPSFLATFVSLSITEYCGR